MSISPDRESADADEAVDIPRSGIVLVTTDPERADSLRAKLEFFDQPVTVCGAGELPVLDEVEAPVGVIVCAASAGCSREEWKESIRAWDPDVPVVVLDDDAKADVRPAGEPQIVRILPARLTLDALAETVRELRLIHAQGGLAEQRRHSELFRSLVGRSRVVRYLREMITKVAASETTVLILGETGTGKEVVARNIHHHSLRRGGPFVAVNCGAIPPDLLESELFGHEKGAFTGALSARAGRFELAAGGTLFLDEIGDMRSDMQVKLLRVLQERRFERLGSTETLATNVRVLAATHCDLEAAIAEGRFREDLFYRLSVFPIETPPLRARIEDLPLLIADLQDRLQGSGMPVARFDAEAVRALASYSWPGNVRELANLVERCAILKPGGTVGVGELPGRLVAGYEDAAQRGEALQNALFEETIAGDLGAEPVELRSLLDGIEMRLIRRALEESDGVVAKAAERLGLRRTTLVEKMRKFSIERYSEASGF